MNYLKNAKGHFKTITTHKIAVMKMCFACGLYKQGLLHDMSKYTPTEFIPGVLYYAGGTSSPNGIERAKFGYSTAWLHHKGRNKHHFEYWLDYATHETDHLVGNIIPKRYMIEMFCDRVCAGKVYNGDNFRRESVLEYYMKGSARFILHKNSAKYLEHLMKMYIERGEEATIRYIRRDLKKDVSGYERMRLASVKE